jgi:hypothetical protein
MRMVKLLFALVAMVPCLALQGLALQAKADDAPTTADLHCLIIGMRLSGSPEAPQRQAGFIETLYYLGRVDVHAPNANLLSLVSTEIGKMKTADLVAESKRCGQFLQVRGQALQDLGKALSANAAPSASPAPATSPAPK